jgi:hypothetical protein
MGTNYYLMRGGKPCPTCGHCDNDELHIGKSSMGWVFSLRVYREHGITSLEDWKREWAREGAMIRDEYDRPVTPEKMLEVVTEREGYATHSPIWYRANGAEPGPHRLARPRCDPPGEGGGTWAYCDYEFS